MEFRDGLASLTIFMLSVIVLCLCDITRELRKLSAALSPPQNPSPEDER